VPFQKKITIYGDNGEMGDLKIKLPSSSRRKEETELISDVATAGDLIERPKSTRPSIGQLLLLFGQVFIFVEIMQTGKKALQHFFSVDVKGEKYLVR